MTDTTLLHELIFASAQRAPAALALRYQGESLSYAQLAEAVVKAPEAAVVEVLAVRPGVTSLADLRFGHEQVMLDLATCVAVIRALLAAGRP